VKVLYRLKDAGYQGFLVGGAVRDLLLGITPKDFGRGDQCPAGGGQALVSQCRLIGRRFRLAHVHSGMKSSRLRLFARRRRRSGEDAEDVESDSVNEGGVTDRVAEPDIPEFTAPNDSEHRAFDERGRILRDNIYGTIEEDVWRRDFAANGLYYNIDDFRFWDFVDGSAMSARTA